MIAFGFLTRVAAFVSAGEMAVAYFMVHAAGKAIGHAPTPTEQFFPILNKGELAVVLCWVFLFMVFYGPGPLEHRRVDRQRKSCGPDCNR